MFSFALLLRESKKKKCQISSSKTCSQTQAHALIIFLLSLLNFVSITPLPPPPPQQQQQRPPPSSSHNTNTQIYITFITLLHTRNLNRWCDRSSLLGFSSLLRMRCVGGTNILCIEKRLFLAAKLANKCFTGWR